METLLEIIDENFPNLGKVTHSGPGSRESPKQNQRSAPKHN